MRRRRAKGLSAEDKAIWAKVASSAQPLHLIEPRPLDTPSAVDPAPPPAPSAAPAPQRSAQAPTRSAGARVSRSPAYVGGPNLDAFVAEHPGGATLHRKRKRRLRRGKLHPDATLDLHGMTADVAHRRLTFFLLEARRRGNRLLLIVTGKGRSDAREPWERSRDGGGVLRRAVPLWLSRAPLADHILEVSRAFEHHGGGGAYYVSLRRLRD